MFFLKKMPYSLKVIKPILMNFEHSEMSSHTDAQYNFEEIAPGGSKMAARVKIGILP